WFTVEPVGSPHAFTVQTSSRATEPGVIEQPERVDVVVACACSVASSSLAAPGSAPALQPPNTRGASSERTAPETMHADIRAGDGVANFMVFLLRRRLCDCRAAEARKDPDPRSPVARSEERNGRRMAGSASVHGGPVPRAARPNCPDSGQSGI